MTERELQEKADAIAMAAVDLILEDLKVSARYDSEPLHSRYRGAKPGDYVSAIGPVRPALPMVRELVEIRSMDVALIPAGEFVRRYLRTELAGTAKALNEAGLPIVTFDAPLPEGVTFSSRAVGCGVALRFAVCYDIRSDSFLARTDVLFAHRTAEPAQETGGGYVRVNWPAAA